MKCGQQAASHRQGPSREASRRPCSAPRRASSAMRASHQPCECAGVAGTAAPPDRLPSLEARMSASWRKRSWGHAHSSSR